MSISTAGADPGEGGVLACGSGGVLAFQHPTVSEMVPKLHFKVYVH